MWICAYARAYTFFLKTIILFSSAPWDATPYRVAEVLTQIYNHYFFLCAYAKIFCIIFIYYIAPPHCYFSCYKKFYEKLQNLGNERATFRLFDEKKNYYFLTKKFQI
jgi:hypothetical protein